MRAGFRKIIRILKTFSKTCRSLWDRVLAAVTEFNALSYVLSYFSLLSTLHVVPYKLEDEVGVELIETTGLPKFTWYAGFFGLVQTRHAVILAAPLLGTLRFKPVGHSVDEKDLDMLGYLFTVPIILLFLIVLWTYHVYMKEISWLFRMYFIVDKRLSSGLLGFFTVRHLELSLNHE